jgi:hypothetical protein
MHAFRKPLRAGRESAEPARTPNRNRGGLQKQSLPD